RIVLTTIFCTVFLKAVELFINWQEILDQSWRKNHMREIFVSQLVKEVLGPRGGSREVLEANPLSEYITGILAPIPEDGGSVQPVQPDDAGTLPIDTSATSDEESMLDGDVEISA